MGVALLFFRLLTLRVIGVPRKIVVPPWHLILRGDWKA